MTQDSRSRPPIRDRRDTTERRGGQTDRRAHERFTPLGNRPIRTDRRQGDRRNAP